MNKIAILILFILVLIFAVAPVGAIVSGTVDDDVVPKYPNVGALMMPWPSAGIDEGRLCTATLIHPKALLTAAHCYSYVEAQGLEPVDVWVSFATDPFEDNNRLYVQEFILHPDFRFGGQDMHDIAVVILQQEVGWLDAQSLPEENYMDDLLQFMNGQERTALELTMVGYGTPERLEAPDTVTNAIRRFGPVDLINLLDAEIVSRGRDPEHVIGCTGDCGGPLFSEGQDGRKLVGIMERSGWECNSSTVHYRVDTSSVLQFIGDNLP